jgi:transcriptional regulator with XRE-family HTH domain
MTFSRRLKELRVTAGMTQEAVAHAARLTVSAVSKLEQRDVDPAWSTVQRLAKALGVDVREFMDVEDTAATPAPKRLAKRKRK